LTPPTSWIDFYQWIGRTTLANGTHRAIAFTDKGMWDAMFDRNADPSVLNLTFSSFETESPTDCRSPENLNQMLRAPATEAEFHVLKAFLDRRTEERQNAPVTTIRNPSVPPGGAKPNMDVATYLLDKVARRKFNTTFGVLGPLESRKVRQLVADVAPIMFY
jgi:hypothetical protein